MHSPLCCGAQNLFSSVFRDFINRCSTTIVNAMIMEALVKLKVDYKDVNVAQWMRMKIM